MKRKVSKILKIATVALIVLVVTALLGFVGSKRAAAICEEIVVDIYSPEGLNLVTEADVRNIVADKAGVIVGQPLHAIHTKSIEAGLKLNPFIKSVKAYETINKKLIVELEERKPLVRIIDKQGSSVIIDSEGFLMPVSTRSAMRLPVITGDFAVSEKAANKNIHVNDSIVDHIMALLFQYATTVYADPFWKAQIQHTHIDTGGDFIAYPQVGNHTINFGPGTEIETKLNRLFVFYKKGLAEAGWNKYAKINLKYKDQIVCTKK